MSKGAKVTLIMFQRDPVDCYESNYVYMGLQKAFKMDINKFAQIKVGALFLSIFWIKERIQGSKKVLFVEYSLMFRWHSNDEIEVDM